VNDEMKLIEAAVLMQFVPDKRQAHREIETAVRNILIAVGEDPDREGLQRTPDRVARMYDELLAGYSVEPLAMINNACFDADYNEMVVVADIDFFSLCEHHMLPFFGRVDIAYIPNGKVLGLSKIPRVVEMFSRRLQLQERMTQEIASFIDELLHPQGVAVLVTGQHLCSMMRGVRKVNAKMVTQAMVGKFEEREMRAQFLERIRNSD
jgi:GTP cyclohydrolase I